VRVAGSSPVVRSTNVQVSPGFDAPAVAVLRHRVAHHGP
jgi:hypothetical protein